MVEASRISGNINNAITATFIALIPKKDRSESFSDFRPIALCNILFKIISKIIGERLKLVLSLHISSHQQAFLKDRNILDAVAMTQECLFSVISKNIDAAILKIDLAKAYDCVDWGFIRILLAKIGLRMQSINWIMACVENVSYVVLVNGIPSSFFKAERGLRQGCPLSPLLFILVMDTLSLQISHAVSGSRIKPVRICRGISLSHNFFVDDVLLTAMLCKESWQCLYGILCKFQSATGLVINKLKSILYFKDPGDATAIWIADLFGISNVPIQNGLKYLGFPLKAKGYGLRDWQWIVDRFYKQIVVWEARFLSLAGRFILVQSVLSQLPVYWSHLFLIPGSIINRLISIAGHFLWGGKAQQSKINLVKMDSIARPRKYGGWGLINLKLFGKALLCKTLFRGIYGTGSWSMMIQNRYLKGRSLEFWYRRGTLGIKTGSAIWNSFRKIFLFSIQNLRWRMFSGANIFIGIDPMVSDTQNLIPADLSLFLQSKGIFTWDKLIKQWSLSSPVWKVAEELPLSHHYSQIWHRVVQALLHKEVKRSGNQDILVWGTTNSCLSIRVKDIYSSLIEDSFQVSAGLFPLTMWKVNCPLKCILFSWLVFNNRNLTWEALQRRGWQGPSRCVFCLSDLETNAHMFFQCLQTQHLWYDLSLSFSFSHNVFASIQEGFCWWSIQNIELRSIFSSVIWHIWIWRNNFIFWGLRPPFSSILMSLSDPLAPHVL